MIRFVQLVLFGTGYDLTNIVAVAHYIRKTFVGDVEHIYEGLDKAVLQQLAGDVLPALNLLLLRANR